VSPLPYRVFAFLNMARDETVIWEDPLDDPAYGSLTVTPLRPEVEAARYEDGAYVMELRAPNEATLASLPVIWRGTLGVDAWLPEPEQGLGLLMECQLQQQNVQYRLAVDPAQQRWRLRRIGDNPQILSDWQSSPAVQAGSAVNHLELTCSRTQLAAAINGTEVARLEVEPMGNVSFNLGLTDLRSTTGGEARFRNLSFVLR
jgi:hypothetical protein